MNAQLEKSNRGIIQANSIINYQFIVPLNTTNLQIIFQLKEPIANLFVKYNSLPNQQNYDFKLSNSSNHSINIQNPSFGIWFVSIESQSIISNFESFELKIHLDDHCNYF